jgi:hypothetical protein
MNGPFHDLQDPRESAVDSATGILCAGATLDKDVKVRLLRRYDEQVDVSDKTYRPACESTCIDGFLASSNSYCWFQHSTSLFFSVPVAQRRGEDSKRVLRYTWVHLEFRSGRSSSCTLPRCIAAGKGSPFMCDQERSLSPKPRLRKIPVHLSVSK